MISCPYAGETSAAVGGTIDAKARFSRGLLPDSASIDPSSRMSSTRTDTRFETPRSCIVMP